MTVNKGKDGKREKKRMMQTEDKKVSDTENIIQTDRGSPLKGYYPVCLVNICPDTYKPGTGK